MGSDLAAQKIIELSKRIRELNAELESEKTKVRQLTKKTKDLENELSKSLKEPVDKSHGDSAESNLRNVIKDLQDKLLKEWNKICEYRNQCGALKQDLKLAHKALEKEVGEGVNIQTILNGNSSWRGRAQQILLLNKKIIDLKKELEFKCQNPSDRNEDEPVTVSPSKSFEQKQKQEIKKIEREQKQAQEKVVLDFKNLEEEHNQLKNRHEAIKSRNKILSTEIQTLKLQNETLQQKGKHDDELIALLMGQLQNQQNEFQKVTKEKEQLSRDKKEQQCLQDTNIMEQMKDVLSEKDAVIKKLQEELDSRDIKILHSEFVTGFHRNENMLDTSLLTNSAISNPTIVPINFEFEEMRILYQSSEMERVQLAELIITLQKRIEKANNKAIEDRKNLQIECMKNIELEKQLNSNRTDQDKSRAMKKKELPRINNLAAATSLKPKENLKASLEIQKDENEALKAALQSTLEAKNDDIKLYQNIMDQTRAMFIQEIKKLRHQTNIKEET